MLEVTVTPHAGVGCTSAAIRIQERNNDRVVEFLLQVRRVKRDTELLGHGARSCSSLCIAALAGEQSRERWGQRIAPERELRTDYIVTLLFEQIRSYTGVNSAGHGDKNTQDCLLA